MADPQADPQRGAAPPAAAPANGDADPAPAAAAAAASAAVVSSSDHNHESSDDDEHDDDDASVLKYGDPTHQPDPTYDDNLDDEDEAWVFRNMRGGVEEAVDVRVTRERGETAAAEPEEGEEEDGAVAGAGSGGSGDGAGDAAAPSGGGRAGESPTSRKITLQQQQQRMHLRELERVKMLKPRSSDAVLSCPCCFTIVCMDCQRHVKYANQFRAMFVMNIGVRWDRVMVWDEGRNELVERPPPRDDNEEEQHVAAAAEGGDDSREGGRRRGSMPTPVPSDDPDHSRKWEPEKGDVYYSVHCASCQTEVAALDMEDEVYHFFGCLASG